MIKITLMTFVFLSVLFLNFSSIYGSVCIDAYDNPLPDDYYNYHTCKKIGSNYCYFPTDLSLAPFFDNNAVIPGKSKSLPQEFSSKYGGCEVPGYSYENKDFKIFQRGIKEGEIRNFLMSCGSYDFSIGMSITHGLYKKTKKRAGGMFHIKLDGNRHSLKHITNN